MYHVLIPVDSNDEGARAAISATERIAAEGASVRATVLTVLKEFEVNEEGGAVDSDKLYEQMDPPTILGDTKTALEERGIETDTRWEHGEPAERIVEIGTELDVDDILLTGRKRSPVGKVLFGSVAQSVLLHADRPVTFVARET